MGQTVLPSVFVCCPEADGETVCPTWTPRGPPLPYGRGSEKMLDFQRTNLSDRSFSWIFCSRQLPTIRLLTRNGEGPVMNWQPSNTHRPAELIRRAPSGRFRPLLAEHLNSLPTN